MSKRNQKQKRKLVLMIPAAVLVFSVLAGIGIGIASAEVKITAEPLTPVANEQVTIVVSLWNFESGPVIPAPVINGTVIFYVNDNEIGQRKTGDNGEAIIQYTFTSPGTYNIRAYYTGDAGYCSANETFPIEVAPQPICFDTGPGTYPSIFGTHNGTIKPNQTINVSKLYTYPCAGTGGHSEHVKIWNESGIVAEAYWKGYREDWHNVTFPESFTLVANETYNYTIRTGSYPQIHRTPALPTKNGWINCTLFVDVNGKIYDDWIPAIKLDGGSGGSGGGGGGAPRDSDGDGLSDFDEKYIKGCRN